MYMTLTRLNLEINLNLFNTNYTIIFENYRKGGLSGGGRHRSSQHKVGTVERYRQTIIKSTNFKYKK